MYSVSEAIDRYEGELARRGCAPATRRKYCQEVLYHFADDLGRTSLPEITTDDCRRFLDQWTNHKTSTLALHVSILRGFFDFCHEEGWVEANPMDPIKRPN